jgi:hypothetical protein
VAGLTVDWHQDGQQATIRQGGVLVNAARLIGVPFLLVGAYFGRFFFEGLFDGGLTIAGWIVLPLLMVGAALPGWCLLMWRRRARLDNAKREVAEELDFIIFKRRWAAPVTSKSTVRLRFEQGSTSSTQGAVTTHSTTRYDIHVDVVTPGQKDTMIALFSEEQKAEAVELAKKAAAFLGITVSNKMVERGTVTSGGVVVDEHDPEWAGEFEDDEDEEQKQA